MTFVHDFIDVPLDFDAASDALLRAEPDWLASAAVRGVQAGGELRARLSPAEAALPLPGKRGRVDVESPYRRADAWVLPFHWRATTLPSLFPQLEAELQVAPLGASEVRLTLSGHYRPPLGDLGRAADAVLLHRVVERSMRVFLGALAAGLRDPHNGPTSRLSRAGGARSPSPTV